METYFFLFEKSEIFATWGHWTAHDDFSSWAVPMTRFDHGLYQMNTCRNGSRSLSCMIMVVQQPNEYCNMTMLLYFHSLEHYLSNDTKIKQKYGVLKRLKRKKSPKFHVSGKPHWFTKDPFFIEGVKNRFYRENLHAVCSKPIWAASTTCVHAWALACVLHCVSWCWGRGAQCIEHLVPKDGIY